MHDPRDGLDPEDDWTLGARARIGTRLAGLTLEELLGVGGQSAVYAATDAQGDRVAVKVMRPDFTVSATSRERLAREVRAANALATLGGVGVLAQGFDAGVTFLVMELLEGETLYARAKRRGGALPLEEVRPIGVALLGVLAEAHARGLVHRDVKPENVFLTRDGGVRVLDFGLAREEGAAHVTRSSATLGTPAFMAPEQARGRAREVEARTDVWGAGATLFTVLAGRYVHLGETRSEMLFMTGTEPAPALASVCPGLPGAVCAIVDRALRFRPEDRWASAAQMRDALASADGTVVGSYRALEQTLPEGEMPMSRTTLPSVPPEVRRWLSVAAGGGLLVAAALGSLGWLRARGPAAAVAAAPRAASCEAADPSDLFVSPTGNQRCSFVSVTAALRAAAASRAPHKTIHVAPGVYARYTSGEVFPIVLRGDVSLVGAGGDATVLEGIGEVNHRGAGGAIADDALGATIVVGDAAGTTRIAGIAIRSGEPAPRFHAFGVFCDRGRAAMPDDPPSTPNLLVEGVDFGAAYDTGLVVTSSVDPVPTGCSARVTSSHFAGSWYGVFALGCGAGVGEVPTEIVIGDDDAASGSTFRGHRHEGDGAGVLLWGCVARAAIRHATFAGGDVGVQIDQRPPPVSFGAYRTTVEDDVFSDLAVAGLRMWRAPLVDVLARNRFERIAGAAVAMRELPSPGSPAIALARANELVGRGVAVRMEERDGGETSADFRAFERGLFSPSR